MTKVIGYIIRPGHARIIYSRNGEITKLITSVAEAKKVYSNR